MQNPDALHAVDEFVSHLSPVASDGANEFKLTRMLHSTRNTCIQAFWPLDDLGRVCTDIRAAVLDQPGRHVVVAQYRPTTVIDENRRALSMADGTLLTGTLTINGTLEVACEVESGTAEGTVVSAIVIEHAIKKGDLNFLKSVTTPCRINMGFDYTPVHLAMFGDRPTVLEWLIKQPGIDVNKPTRSGSSTTALLFSLPDPHVDWVWYLCILVRAGMSLAGHDKYNVNIFHNIRTSQPQDIRRLFRNRDVVSKLMEYAVYVFERSEGWYRPPDNCPAANKQLMTFFNRADKAVRTPLTHRVPIPPLVDMILSYISGSRF